MSRNEWIVLIIVVITALSFPFFSWLGSQAESPRHNVFLYAVVFTSGVAFILMMAGAIFWESPRPPSPRPGPPRVTWEEMRARERELQRRRLTRCEKLEKVGRYEEAAECYEALEMLEKAGEMRRMAKTTYVISTSFQMGKDGVISVSCPHCGASQPLETKSRKVTCRYCGMQYFIAKKILDMI